MKIQERAACIADKADGTARGALRRKRVYDCALKMLGELAEEISAQHARVLAPSEETQR